MDWDDIRIFLAAARAGSVRQAAADFKANASTISRRLGTLERRIGSRLFLRRPDGLELTDAGREMLESAVNMEGAFQQLDRRVSGRDKNMFGLVRLTVPYALGALVTEGLGPFLDRHPRIEVEVQTTDAVFDLDARESDVAVRSVTQPPSSLVGQRVAQLTGALYASTAYLAKHPAPLPQAEAHRWIDWDRRFADKPPFVWLAKRYPERRIVVRGLSTMDVVESARAGLGIAPLPCVVGDAIPNLKRIEDVPVTTSTSIWVLMHKEVRPSERVRAVARWVASHLRGQRTRIEGRRKG